MQGRVLLVDDDSVSLAMLRVCLETMEPAVEVVGQATDAEQALRMAIEERPDVVLADFALPRQTGLQMASWIMRASPQTQVILLSEYDEPWIRYQSARDGIFAFLKKDEPLPKIHRTVVDALQASYPTAVDDGERPPAPQPDETPDDGIAPMRLAPRETRVIELAAQGYSTRGIAEELNITFNTVRDHLKHVYRKLGVHSRHEAVLAFQRRMG